MLDGEVNEGTLDREAGDPLFKDEVSSIGWGDDASVVFLSLYSLPIYTRENALLTVGHSLVDRIVSEAPQNIERMSTVYRQIVCARRAKQTLGTSCLCVLLSGR